MHTQQEILIQESQVALDLRNTVKLNFIQRIFDKHPKIENTHFYTHFTQVNMFLPRNTRTRLYSLPHTVCRYCRKEILLLAGSPSGSYKSDMDSYEPWGTDISDH